jgi:hypothetical protein
MVLTCVNPVRVGGEGKSEQTASEGLVTVNICAKGNLLFSQSLDHRGDSKGPLIDVVFCSDLVFLPAIFFVLVINLSHPS